VTPPVTLRRCPISCVTHVSRYVPHHRDVYLPRMPTDLVIWCGRVRDVPLV
jgi:hypothetical protein